MRPISGRTPDVAQQEARDDRCGPLELIDVQADRRHHGRQGQDDDVGVCRRERDRNDGESQHDAAGS